MSVFKYNAHRVKPRGQIFITSLRHKFLICDFCCVSFKSV